MVGKLLLHGHHEAFERGTVVGTRYRYSERKMRKVDKGGMI
jgi:hypothetical protein